MTKYSKDLKERVLNDMRPPNAVAISELEVKYNIPNQTLYAWRKKALDQGTLIAENNTSKQWSHDAKFAAVIETAAMTETEKGEYCRQHGLFIEQLKQWRQTCLAGFQTQPAVDRETQQTISQKDKQIKRLEKEINRKDKALAESAALLVLSKKYRGYLDDEEY